MRWLGGRRCAVGGGVDGAEDRVGSGRAARSSPAGRGAGAVASRRCRSPGREAVRGARARARRVRPPSPRRWRSSTKRSGCSRRPSLDAESFRLATRHWLAAAADTASADPAEAGTPDQVSSLHLSRTFEGWLRVDGSFCPDDADLVEAALGVGVDQALRAAHDGDPSRRRPGGVGAAGRRVRRPRVADHAPGALRRVGARPLPGGGRRAPRSADGPRGGGVRRRRLPRRPERAGARSSTSAARPAVGRPPSAGRSPHGTGVACSPAATGHRRGPTSITVFHGRKTAARRWRMVCSSAGVTTRSSINADGASPSTTATPSPEDPTAHRSPSNDGPSTRSLPDCSEARLYALWVAGCQA